MSLQTISALPPKPSRASQVRQIRSRVGVNVRRRAQSSLVSMSACWLDMRSVEVTAGILVCYVVGVPAFGLRDFLSRVFHALQDTKTPFRVSCLVVALNIVLNLILRVFLGANGLALATSIAGTAGMVTLLVLLKKRFRRLGLGRILPDLLKIVAAALICAGVCLALNRALPPAMGTGRVFIRLAVCAGTSLITYVAACFILRVKTIRTFAADVLRRGR